MDSIDYYNRLIKGIKFLCYYLIIGLAISLSIAMYYSSQFISNLCMNYCMANYSVSSYGYSLFSCECYINQEVILNKTKIKINNFTI